MLIFIEIWAYYNSPFFFLPRKSPGKASVLCHILRGQLALTLSSYLSLSVLHLFLTPKSN